MLIATALTLAILWAAGRMLRMLFAGNRDKILAALQGRSWAAERSGRATTMPFIPRCRAAGPALLPAELRAAA
jgi:hypothetical protein